METRPTLSQSHIFVSHISEEAELAALIKRHLIGDFLGLPEVFVSSDITSIGAGQNWLSSLETALQQSSLLLVLCSHASLKRPWVNFELGAAWIKKLPIIPVCHSGLQPSSLPIPLSLLQGIEAADREGWTRLYDAVARTLGVRPPRTTHEQLLADISSFEQQHALSVGSTSAPDPAVAGAARKRVYDALNDPAYRWRTISRLAVLSGLSEMEVVDMLSHDDNVKLGHGDKSKERKARLRNRDA